MKVSLNCRMVQHKIKFTVTIFAQLEIILSCSQVAPLVGFLVVVGVVSVANARPVGMFYSVFLSALVFQTKYFKMHIKLLNIMKFALH